MRAREESIDIAAEPEAVFDLIHDYTRRLEWDPFLRQARLLDGADAAAVGVKSLCTARWNSGGLAMETVYVSFERPSVAAVKMTRGPGVLDEFAASLRQEAVGPHQTRVTYRFKLAAHPRWLRFVLDPILFAIFAREVRIRLSALKRFLERS
jgi:Polyketide cyclase / dehydrase and lipid transport